MPPSLTITKHITGAFPLKCSDSLACSDQMVCSEAGMAVNTPGSLTLSPLQSGAAYPSSGLAYPGVLYPSEGSVLILVPNT